MALAAPLPSSSPPSPCMSFSPYTAPLQDPQVVFEPSIFSAPSIPQAFIWPEATSNLTTEEQFIDVPTIDLAQFRIGGMAMQHVARAAACAGIDIGFFHVVNHGVSKTLVDSVHMHTQRFFELPLSIKQRANRQPGESFGYANSFTGRFSSRLPWKETLSVQPSPISNISAFLEKVLGSNQHEECSEVFEEYSREMERVGLEVLEVLALGLGLDRSALRSFFEAPDNSSILRLNYYPPCQQPGLTFGTGPHADPTGLTLLHQDHVSGLQVLNQGAWYTVSPRPDAFVVNIGDTLMALTNGCYKSCIHRALVNSKTARRSMAFFFNPGFRRLLSPPKQLINDANPRAFHDFTWEQFLFFTQSVYRPGVNTLHSFNTWLATQT